MQMLLKNVVVIVVLLSGLCLSHDGHEMMEVDPDGSMVLIKSNWIIFHAVCMTLLTWICLPFGYYLIIKKSYLFHKLVQSFNVTMFFLFGLLAFFQFGSHSSIHSILGYFILCFIFPLQIFIALLKYCFGSRHRMSDNRCYHSIHYFLGIIIITFLVPIQWMLGIAHLTGPHSADIQYVEHHWNYFLGHIFPGYFFVIIGILYLYHRSNIEKLMKIEILIVIILPIPELIGEIYTIGTPLSDHGWDHVTLDCLMIFAGILGIIYYYLQLPDQRKLHRITTGFALFVYGYAMLSHQHGMGLKTKIHSFFGQLVIAMAILRTFDQFFYCSIFAILCGITFTFSMPTITYYWEYTLFYPPIPYMIIVISFGFYVWAINAIIDQIYNQQKQKQKHKKTDDTPSQQFTPFIDV